MKRSEMINRICSDLTERFGSLPDYTVLAEIMLCSCEEAGMMPPIRFLDRERGLRITEWEPEDEKK